MDPNAPQSPPPAGTDVPAVTADHADDGAVKRDRLPRERDRSLRCSSVVLGLVGALVVLAAFNQAAGVYLSHFGLNRGYRGIKLKWQLAGDASLSADWVVLGDSSGNQGFDPDEWRRVTGDEAVNLCTIGDMGVAGDVWLLERYLETHPPPKAVIVMHTFDVWPRPHVPAVMGQLPAPWGYWRDAPLQVNLSPAQQLELFASRHLPIISQSTTLMESARRIIDRPSATFEDAIHVDDRGQMTWKIGKPSTVITIAKSVVERGLPFAMSNANRDALIGLTQLADAHDFEIHMVPSPLLAELAAQDYWAIYFKDQAAALKNWADQSPRTHWHPVVMTYPPTEMDNVDHLVEAAAIDFTRRMATGLTGQRPPADFTLHVDAASTRIGLGPAATFGRLGAAKRIIADELSNPMTTSGPLTLHAAVRLTALPRERAAIVSRWNSESGDRCWELGVAPNGAPYFAVSSIGRSVEGAGVFLATQPLPLARDVVLSATFEPGRRVAMFVNGQKVMLAERDIPARIHLGHAPLTLGNRADDDADEQFEGAIGVVRLLHTASNDANVADAARSIFEGSPAE